jgi:hypothetical protein
MVADAYYLTVLVGLLVTTDSHLVVATRTNVYYICVGGSVRYICVGPKLAEQASVMPYTYLLLTVYKYKYKYTTFPY